MESVTDALEGLELLGAPMSVSEPDIEAAIESEHPQVERKLAELGLEEVANLPEMTDERSLAIVRLLDRMILAGYSAGQVLLIRRIILRMMALVLEGGHSPFSCMVVPLYAYFFKMRLKCYDEGDALGRLSLRIMDGLSDQARRGQFFFSLGQCVMYWMGTLEVRKS
jgi:predicted ATPase